MNAVTPWQLQGLGFEFCNCQPGCTCNFSGFPTSADGSCKAAVLTRIESGHCGDVELSGIDAVGLLATTAAAVGPDRATYEVAGVVRAPIAVTDDDLHSGFAIPGVGRAQGSTLKNPVTGEDHRVAIDLDQGFIWKRGDCGQGSFEVAAEGVALKFDDSNWIRYRFDWTNQG